MITGTDNKPFRGSQRFPSPGERARPRLPGFVAASVLFCLGMLVREPVHGMQGLLERQGYKSSYLSPERGMTELRFTPAPHVPGAAL
jgi:hypothetical protein